jgi:hypothetical protein
MKKFYAFLLTALAVIASPNAVAENSITDFQKKDTPTKINIRNERQTYARMQTPERESDYDTYIWQLQGEGMAVMHALYDTYQLSADPEVVEVYQARGYKGLYKIVGVWSQLLNNGTIYIDATNPDLILVTKQEIGIKDPVDGETYLASQSYLMQQSGYTAEEIEANSDVLITIEENTVKIPTKALLLNWPNAPEDSEYETNPKTWYYCAVSESYITLPSHNAEDSPWKALENATFKENLFYGLFTDEENTEFIDAEVYQNSNNPTQYRIVHPLKATYDALSVSGESPDMTLDATDPANICIAQTSAGVYSTDDGTYYYFSDSWYNDKYGAGRDSTDPEKRITLETDGEYSIIRFPYDCITILGNSSANLYSGAPFESVLKFKTSNLGVGDLEVEEESGEAVYYNLQGVRTERPARGIAIRIQNGKATKVLLR